jgi:DNA-directed RNA polymerase specialized sigma24 family protein
MIAISRPLPSLDLAAPHNAARRVIVQALYREYGARLVEYAASRVRDEDAAEDIVQEAFSSMIDGRFSVPAVDVHRKLEAVVRFHCSAHRRANARRRATSRALLEVNERSEKAGWRAFRASLRGRGNRHGDDDAEEGQ